MATSIWGSIWRNISSRLRKHLLYHLIIPLIGGIVVEALVDQALVHKWIAEDNKIAKTWGLFVFRALILILGVTLSWLLVMFLLIGRETRKNLSRRNLMRLEKRLDTATGYYGVSIIHLADWFEPGSQLYLAKLLKRKLEVDHFEHDRTLLFFSSHELKNTRVDLTDERHYAKCLALMHRDFGIPLSFLKREEIFEILKDELEEDERLQLGCYPRWTTWRPFTKFQCVRLHWLRRRIPQLDFGLVTPSQGDPFVLRVSMSEGQLRIMEELEKDKAKPYIKLAKLIKGRVYELDQTTLKSDYDFVSDFESSDRSRRRQARDARLVRVEQLATQHDAQFRIKKYTRFVDIAEKSGDVSVREEFEGVTAFPDGAVRERLERHLSSQSGYFCEPQIIEFGTQIGWEWEGESTQPGERRGFITFYPPVENEPVRFVIQRKTHNAMHFNQRDRQDKFEEVFGYIENLHELYVLKVRFPKNNFPPRFRIHVEVAKDQHDIDEEKLALSRFARFTCDSTAVLVLDRPLPGYTYRIRWDLPKDDIEELNLSGQRSLSGHQTLILREANKRLLTLASDAERSKNVLKHLEGLQYQIAHATIGQYEIDDPEIEVSLHAYNDDKGKQGLVMVASNGKKTESVVPIGRGTVGQAYKRRAIVSWFFTSDSDDCNFWDYGSGHLGIVSVPLFFPLQTSVGGRVCVLSIATRSPESGFLNVIDQLDDPTARAFTQLVNAWYAKTLAKAIGLPDLSKENLN